MKLLRRLFFLIVVLLLVGTVVSVFLMVEDNPIVAGSQSLSTTDIGRARVFMDNTDPRNLAPGEVTAFTVEEKDLELLMNYALDQLEGGGARVNLSNGLANLTISARLPDNPLGDYINLQLSMSQWGDSLTIEELKIGGLNVPAGFANTGLQYAHEQLQRVPEYVAALDAINGYSIANNRLNIVYQWQPDLIEQLSNRGRDLLISPEDQERLLAHATNLASITQDSRMGNVTSLANLISPMFLFAQVRGGNPVEENRAAIIAMSMHIMGVSVPRVLGLSKDAVPQAGRHKFVLSERGDFAQHFLVSAGLALSAGTGLADSIGLLKEMEDSQGGSGFSFTDIGADRTGVRFAELATASQAQAKSMQEMLALNSDEDVFMAEFRDLPESMPEETFKRIYGGVGTAAYNNVIDDIERRISSARLFRQLDNR
ncbi:MAG: hypothetical protein COA96_03720 [SAR86 cluster bacterium]|uniref:Uncharacterized protein n=1 Tax=SAR86 cluster bacterium TaxID=2030880 RepID=A0A2A5B6V3_9GAMM|nr:MAG: hypothetical protein COA96_03720 [SAR86 cluster bacterium]